MTRDEKHFISYLFRQLDLDFDPMHELQQMHPEDVQAARDLLANRRNGTPEESDHERSKIMSKIERDDELKQMLEENPALGAAVTYALLKKVLG